MRKMFPLVLLHLTLLFPLFSHSQEGELHPFLTDKFYLEGGVFFPSKNIQLGANGSTPNENIDFGNTFDLNDNEITYFFNLEWRWNRKWRVTVETFGIDNGSRSTLDEDIAFEDLVFEKGSYVRGGVELRVYRIFFGRTISSGPKHSLGVGLGIHGMNVGASIEGEVRTNDGDLEFQRRKVSALLPLPNIGGWYHWAPTKKWAFIARVDWFGITIDKYGGGLWNLAPGVKFQMTKNFGIGAEYRYFFLNARVDDDNWQGKFNMDFSGPLLTIHGNF